jgi:hypothetical protein
MSNSITLTIDLPLDLLRNAVISSVNRELASPTYGNQGGSAFRAIDAAVKTELLTFDFTPLIQQFAKARLSAVVDEIVTLQLRERAKAKAKEMAKNNQLFEDTP